jgi:hypothetical protein
MTSFNIDLMLPKEVKKLAKLFTKAEEATTRDKAKKVLKKAKKLQKKIQARENEPEVQATNSTS